MWRQDSYSENVFLQHATTKYQTRDERKHLPTNQAFSLNTVPLGTI